MIDCSQLQGRLRSICDGTSGLPEDVRAQYIALWEGNPPPEAPSLECVHRGNQLGWVACPDCPTGNVHLKTFICAVHDLCVMTGGAGEIKGCIGCDSRLEKAAG